MAKLWQFFGLPHPEAKAVPPRQRHPQQPAEFNMQDQAGHGVHQTEAQPDLNQEAQQSHHQLQPQSVPSISQPPNGWTGPRTPTGEAFHDLGMQVGRNPVIPSLALRYIEPDAMRRLPMNAMLSRVVEGDTVIVDLRSLLHMESHQMACRRDLKHMGQQAGVGIFALDREDKLLMIPGQHVVVDVHKHELGLPTIIPHS